MIVYRNIINILANVKVNFFKDDIAKKDSGRRIGPVERNGAFLLLRYEKKYIQSIKRS